MSPSNSVVRLGGLCFTGPDRRNFAAAFGLLIILSIAFVAYTCPFLVRLLPVGVGIPVVVVGVLLVAFTVAAFVATAYSDPGVVPRQPPVEEKPFRHFVRQTTAAVNGFELTRKFCGVLSRGSAAAVCWGPCTDIQQKRATYTARPAAPTAPSVTTVFLSLTTTALGWATAWASVTTASICSFYGAPWRLVLMCSSAVRSTLPLHGRECRSSTPWHLAM